ncbi:MAG: hypothetical protein IPJ71_18585 [Bdellovibrionales bacterium]|nr:hypothetical protein [Bdellovibrionales bacterium]
MDWILPLVGGLGIGSMLTRLIEHFLVKSMSKQNRFYQEKREAYLGLLSALHAAAVSPSNENSKNYALWQTRVELFGAAEVAKSAQGIVDTNDGPRETRDLHFKNLVQEMKKDLKD